MPIEKHPLLKDIEVARLLRIAGKVKKLDIQPEHIVLHQDLIDFGKEIEGRISSQIQQLESRLVSRLDRQFWFLVLIAVVLIIVVAMHGRLDRKVVILEKRFKNQIENNNLDPVE